MDPLSFETRIPSTDPTAEEERRKQREQQLRSIQPAQLTPTFTPTVRESTDVAPVGVLAEEDILSSIQEPEPQGLTEEDILGTGAVTGGALTEEDLLFGATPIEEIDVEEEVRPSLLGPQDVETAATAVGAEDYGSYIRQRIEEERAKKKAREFSATRALSGSISNLFGGFGRLFKGVGERNLQMSKQLSEHAAYNYDYANGNFILDTVLTSYGLVRDLEAGAREELAVIFDFVAKHFKDLENYFYTKPVDAPMFSPVGIADLVVRNLPQLAVIATTYAMNPVAGRVLVGALAYGESEAAIEEYEKVTGNKVPEGLASSVSAGVAMITPALGSLGLDAILKTSTGTITMQTLKKVGMASLTEGVTEGAEQAIQILGQLQYNEYYSLSEDASPAIAQAVAAGTILGGVMGGTFASLSALSTPSARPGAALIGFDRDGEFSVPLFEVTAKGHRFEGQTVTYEEAINAGIALPEFRTQLLKDQLKTSVASMSDLESEIGAVYVRILSNLIGQDTEAALAQMQFAFTNKLPMQEGDLMQYVARPATDKISMQDYSSLVNAQNIVRNADKMGQSREDAIKRARIATGWYLQPTGKWVKQIEPIKLNFDRFFQLYGAVDLPRTAPLGPSTVKIIGPDPNNKYIDSVVTRPLPELQQGVTKKETLFAQIRFGDLVDPSSEIFTYYPQIADIPVVIGRARSTLGGYQSGEESTKTKTGGAMTTPYIFLNVNADFNFDAFGSEIHYLLERGYRGKDLYEEYAKTGNVIEIEKLVKRLGATLAHEVQHQLAEFSPADLEQGGSQSSFATYGPLDPLFEQDNPGVQARYREAEAKKDFIEIAAVTAEYSNWLSNKYGNDPDAISDYGFDFYKRLLGEVDARQAGALFELSFYSMLAEMNIPISPSAQAKLNKQIEVLEKKMEVPAEAALSETIRISQVVTRMPGQISDAERSLRAVANGDIKGATALIEQGKIVAKMFQGSNFYTVAHELAHMFRLVLPRDMQVKLATLYGVPQDAAQPGVMWEPAIEEKFAKDFLSYVATQAGRFAKDKSSDQRLVPFFHKFAETLEYSVVAMIGSPDAMTTEGFSIDPTTEQVFSDIFKWRFEDASPLRKLTRADRLWARLYKALSITKYTEAIGIPQTGLAIRDVFTIWTSHIQDGAQLVERVSAYVNGDEQEMVRAFLAAEDGTIVADIYDRRTRSVEIPGKGTYLLGENDVPVENKNANFENAVIAIREYFDNAEKDLIGAGAFERGFVDRIINELRFELTNQSGASAEDTMKLIAELERAMDTKFVHISIEGLLEGLAQTNRSAYKRALTLLTAKKRKTLRFADLLEGEDAVFNKEDISFSDIIRHYANRKGRDMAILNLRNVAQREGAIIAYDGANTTANYVVPGSIPFIKDKQMHPYVMQAFQMLLEPAETGNILLTYLRHSKMGQFFNPAIMPMYNTIQMNQAGVNFLGDPVTVSKIVQQAWKESMERSPRYMEYQAMGLSAQPDVPLRSQQERTYLRALFFGKYKNLGLAARPAAWMKEYVDYVVRGTSDSRSRQRKAEDTDFDRAVVNAKNLVDAGGRVVLGMYNSLSDLAWMGDDVSRVATAMYLEDVKGMTRKQAVAEAARATGNYADIPRNTRRVLNLLFFTPSFKIAMANFFTSSLRSMALVLNKSTRNMYHKEKAMVVTRTLGIFFAYDFIMTAVLGFEREELGRRYFKRVETLDTEERFPRGQKELTLSWSSPHNLFSKYLAKVNTILLRPETINRPGAVLSQFGYEFHPAYTIIGNVLANKRSVSNEPIYNPFDSDVEIAMKVGRYIVGNTYAVFRAALDQDLDPRGRELLVENYNKSIAFAIELAAFPYERDPYEQRVLAQFLALIRAFEQSSGLKIAQGEYLSGQMTKPKIDERLGKLEPRSKELLRRVDQLIAELAEYYYPVAPDFYETADIIEMRDRPLSPDRFKKAFGGETGTGLTEEDILGDMSVPMEAPVQ